MLAEDGGRHGWHERIPLICRDRVVGATQGRLLRRQAAAHFSVAVMTAIKWVERDQETGNAAPGKMGGHKPKTFLDAHADWLRRSCRERAFILRGLVRKLAMECALKVDFGSV